jgi:hypothetical protein
VNLAATQNIGIFTAIYAVVPNRLGEDYLPDFARKSSSFYFLLKNQ